MRVFGAWYGRENEPSIHLQFVASDEHPRVRLEAVRAVTAMKNRYAPIYASVALDRPMDQFLDFALWQTMRDLEEFWLPEAQMASRVAEMSFSGDAKRLVFALKAVGTPAVVRPLVTLLREGAVPAESEESVLSLIGSQGGRAELGLVLDLVTADDETPASRRFALLESLMKATRQRQVRPDGDLARLGGLLGDAGDVRVRAAAARAAGLWKVESLRKRLDELASGPADLAADSRGELWQAAMDGLALLGGDASRATLERLCGQVQSLVVRRMAVAALASLDLKLAAARAVEVLADSKSDADAAEIFRSFLERKAGPAALVAALRDRELPSDVAKIGVRAASIAGRGQPEFVAALTKAGRLGEARPPLSTDEVQAMVREVVERGDAERGEDVYRRRGLDCQKCHAIAGAGGLVGPDLVSIGASAQIDYLIDSLYDPNKQIKEGFHSLVVATRDGRVLTGIKVREAGSELVLRDAENRELAIPASAIEEQKPGGSLMPTGLIDPLTTAERLDLVRFLSLLGKTDTPYAVSPARVARRWLVPDLTPDSEKAVRHAGLDALVAGSVAVLWRPVYAKVSGLVPLADLGAIKIPYQASNFAVARTELDVSAAGKVRLVLHSPAGMKLWLDQTPLDPRPELDIAVSKGPHTLTLAVNTDLADGLRLELLDVPAGAAQARLVNEGR